MGKYGSRAPDGVSVIDPRHLPFNKLPPPVHIEQVTADGRSTMPSHGLRLPPRVRDLSIDYTALSLVVPEKVHFRFKLEGQDEDWREVVNDRQRAVLESAAGQLSLPRDRLQQQRRVERGRRVSGFRDCAGLLPDELVSRAVCARVSGDALDRLSASRPRFRTAPGIVRAGTRPRSAR